jgi:hypothetical protein
MSYEKETNSDASCRFGIGKCQNESFNLGRDKPRFYNSSLKLLSLKKVQKPIAKSLSSKKTLAFSL